jgi:hypothetical protein
VSAPIDLHHLLVLRSMITAEMTRQRVPCHGANHSAVRCVEIAIIIDADSDQRTSKDADRHASHTSERQNTCPLCLGAIRSQREYLLRDKPYRA